jgi:hypothetical protein
MKPIHILNTLLTVLLVLLFVSILIPKNGIKLNEKFTLKFPTFEEVFTTEEVEYADITHIIEQHSSLSDSIIFDPLDSIAEESIEIIDTFRVRADSLRKVIHSLEFPHNNSDILNPFFGSLNNLQKIGKIIRILHYGDSQIEGDRISSYLRNKFQTQFGGSGPGLIPAREINAQSKSIKHYTSNNWERHSIFFEKDTLLPHRRFGVLNTFCRFSPYDTTESFEQMNEAWISIEKYNLSFRSVRNFNKFRMFYGFNKKPVETEFYVNDSLLFFETLPAKNKLCESSWDFETSINNLKIVFKGQDSPDIYALSLDNNKGIALDNIPLRGSSGTDFTRTNLSFTKEMYNQLNVKLIIMQFGVNVVPHIAKSYKYYENRFYRQLVALKKMNPNIPIIVIGVSDMSRKMNGHFESYPNIEKIRTAQKNAAFNAGCAFWDMYEAMGGKNSMPSWVFAQPPLAQKDFTHFSNRGSRIIAQMFYNAIMDEYTEYLNEQKN